MIEIDIKDEAVTRALNRLAAGMASAGPVLRVIGEEMLSRIQHRFDAGAGPDGQRWKPNAPATLFAYIGARGGFGKRGRVTKRGAAIGAGKKPLIGLSRDLSRQNHYDVSGNTLTVGNTMIYAAIQQFGGKAGRGRKVTIPPRPFFPVTLAGNLYPQESDLIVTAVSDYLRGLIA